jgi:hypothetical protein
VLSTNVEAYDGTEKLTTSTNDPRCAVFKIHSVLTEDDRDAAGESITVFEGSKCDPKKSRTVLYLKNDMGQGFAGLFEPNLFVDQGTGPDGRGLAIYDLIKKKQVYYAVYSPIMEPRIENNALIFYKDLSDLRYKEHRHCPDAEKWLHESGLDYGFEQKTKVDLKTMTDKAIGKVRCSQRQ